jgi:hypothetical protein
MVRDIYTTTTTTTTSLSHFWWGDAGFLDCDSLLCPDKKHYL